MVNHSLPIDIERLCRFGNNRIDTEKIADALRQKHRRMRFAHRHEHALQALTRILDKREQLLAVGVSRISRKRLPLRVDADVLAVYFDAFLAVLNTPPERAR